MKKNLFHIITAVIVLVFAGSCQKELPNQPKANQSPTTRLWITSDNTLHETVSRQHIYFYGEDPDGYVTGFLVATGNFKPALKQIPNPDTLTYSWTTKNDSTISLPLLAIRDSFCVIVRAVDNRFSGATLGMGAVIKGFPNPYYDKDSNGVYSAGDVYLTGLNEAVDPKGAIQMFPIVNTPPKVQFAVTAGDNPITIEQPETTMTASSFVWVGSDDDGNQTIKNYRIALNDTTIESNWFELPSTSVTKKKGEADTVKVLFYVKRADSDIAGSIVEAEVYTGTFGNLQLRGKIKNLKLNSTNVLYLQARDLAGEYSPSVRMPSSSSLKWYVKKPQGRMLVIGDFAVNRAEDRDWVINKYYRDIFSGTTVLNGQLGNYDILVLDRNKTVNYSFFNNPAFIKTLQMYDVVLWPTDQTPNITAAQIGLFYYTNTLNAERNTYGHTIFTTQFAAAPSYDDLKKYNDFAPLDSISNDGQYGYNRLPVKDPSTGINPKIIPMAAGYPALYADSMTTGGIRLSNTGQHTAFFKRLYKRTDSKYIYKIDSSRVSPPNYKGELEIGIIDNNKRFVMFGLPLHLLNGWEHNLPLFFKKVIEDEFGIH
ncbi:MAG: hypothetical protein ACOYNS_02270 [Bacteroidota bacterium]